MNAEKILGDAVTEQAIQQPAKAPPASWLGILLRAKLTEPEWDGVNKAFWSGYGVLKFTLSSARNVDEYLWSTPQYDYGADVNT